MDQEELVRQLQAVFFEEASEGLDVMETLLMTLDEQPEDADALDTIFRAAHSIKGGAGSFGFDEITRFTHSVETLLDEMRAGTCPVTRKAIEALLSAVDHLRGQVGAAQGGSPVDEAVGNAILKTVDDILKANASSSNASEGEDSSNEKKEAQQSSSSVSEPKGSEWTILFRPYPELMEGGSDPLLLIRQLASFGELTSEIILGELPIFLGFEPKLLYLSWQIKLVSDTIDENSIRQVFEWVEDCCELDIRQAEDVTQSVKTSEAAQDSTTTLSKAEDKSPQSEAKSPQSEAKSPQSEDLAPQKAANAPNNSKNTGSQPAKSSAGSTSLRVSIDKIDDLIDLVGELVITKSMLCQVNKDPSEQRLQKLSDGFDELSRITRELQDNVMRIRMVPINFLFSRFPRVVRDVSSSLGKQVNLSVRGESTELDKTVAEQLNDPLVHLVRNALDHGVEVPDVREQNGKPMQAQISLDAYHQGGQIVVEVRDDGAGIDPQKILRKAVQKGLAREDEMFPPQKCYEFLFQPGFSTADKVTDLSGRGVGLDVVHKNIRNLGGRVEIESEIGKGTCFRFRLPLTLSILDGQLINSSGQIYVIPMSSITELVVLDPNQISTIAGATEVYRLREDYIPLVRLDKAVGLDRKEDNIKNRELIVVVEGEGCVAGIVVDELLDQQQIVIKSLETNYRKVEGMSGATVLGDGQVALILDVPEFVRSGHMAN